MLFLLVVLAGLVLGSFATAIIYRVPRDMSLATPRSSCPHCKKTLEARDLMPLVSWLKSKGKCRHCAQDIGVMYPVVEGLVLVMCVLAYWLKGPTPEALFIILAVPFLVALVAIDLEFMILPNRLIAVLSCLGLGLAIWQSFYLLDVMPFYMAVVSAAVYAVLAWMLGWGMTRVLKKDALGFGDVKFFAMAGIWLGVGNLALFCLLAGLLGIVFSLFWKTKKGEGVFPFGPALMTAMYLILVTQPTVLL